MNGEVIKEITFSVPLEVQNHQDGFIFFSKIFDQCIDRGMVHVTFDFTNTVWFEANLVAVFASLIETLDKQNCDVTFLNVSKAIEKIFKKNGFYRHYELGNEIDIYDSTIPFKVFRVDDGEGFTEYLNDEVIPKINLPLTKTQIRYFKMCLQEVFENASMHSASDCVYTCGQYYYQKQKVAFTIVDIGKTIGANVQKKVYEITDDGEAIEWATKFGNTTKVAKDGGIGLHLLKDYLNNNGILQIISGQGYWEKKSDELIIDTMPNAFGGTIVNLVSDMNEKFTDKTHYEKF